MTGRDDSRSNGTPGAAASSGLSEDATPYAAEPRSIKTLDEATLQSLTDECSKTVNTAIEAHLNAGRFVYSQEGAEINYVKRISQK